MIKLKEECFNMIDEFEREYPRLADEVEYCYPSGLNEITFILYNGDKIAYDALMQKTRSVYEAEIYEDCYAESEEECKREFGRKLKRRMMYSGYDVTGLADKLQVSTGTISNYRNGVATPNLYMLRRLAWALECSVTELIDF